MFIGYIHDNQGAFPFQTLNFKWGTQQEIHSDLVHFDTLPQRGLLTAAWTALEDIHPDSGPLVWYPKSHKMGYWDYDELGLRADARSLELSFFADYQRYEQTLKATIASIGLDPSYATLQRGESFIWASSLLHGGSPVKNTTLTRKSQVTHYYLNGATSYWQPRNSIPAINKYTYKCEIPVCVESGHTNCLQKQLEMFRTRRRTIVNDSLPWVKEHCKQPK